MECRLKCEKPGEIAYTLTVTMTAAEWERLRDQLREGKNSYCYPAQSLVNYIDDLLGQARKIYWPMVDATGPVPKGQRGGEA